MSSPRAGLAEGAAAFFVRMYPEAWRQRYEQEMLALVQDDPPGPRGIGSLARGAIEAHLRPRGSWSAAPSPFARVRLSLTGIFSCWIALSLMGLGFQKETEGPGFAAAASHHPLLGIAHQTILAGAVLGAAAIAVGGLPLAWRALAHAGSQRDRRLAALLALPPAALACFAGLTALLVALDPGEAARTTWSALAILAPWWLGGLACAAACAIAPRLVMARLTLPPRSLRRAANAAVALAVAMGAISVALLVYDVALASSEPRLSGESGGPLWPSTGVVLAAGAAVAILSTAAALLSLARGRRAVSQLAPAPEQVS